jgi:hypothetical protein
VDAGYRIAAIELNELLHLSQLGTFVLIFGHRLTVSRDMICESEHWTRGFGQRTARNSRMMLRVFVLDNDESIMKMNLDQMHFSAQNEQSAEESDADFEDVCFKRRALILSYLNDNWRMVNCWTLIDSKAKHN